VCGIAGYIGQEDIGPDRVERCLRLMRRRGPDAEGVYRHARSDGRKVCLLHSRLSIIDLDPRANQPFRFGSKVLAGNGELYNYLEIKKDLTERGRSFSTTSDTEVLLQCLDEFGWPGLDRCEGMWAFALYDEHDGSLLLCRDRFGEKPLYLFEEGGGCYFASEVKFLSALAGRRFDVNFRQIYRFLVNGYKSLYKSPQTFFEKVRELPAGHLLQVLPGGTSQERPYWLPSRREDSRMTYDDAVAGAREKVIEAVKLRLRADVPLAFCMSGGVDSNAIISIAKNVFGYDVHGFTVLDPDERYAEQDLVDHAVSELGIKHTSIPTQPHNFLPNLRTLIQYHDAPVYTISYYAHWLLMKSIADHGYKISVSGTAADELFTGYYDHHSMYLYEVRGEESLFSDSLSNWNKHIKPIVRNPLLQDPFAFTKNPGQRDHIYLDAESFAARLKVPFQEPFTETLYCDELLRNRMLNELFQESVPVILHEDDLNAMYFSIENRSPFLDRKLFEFCYSIPTRHLIRDGFNKKILRDALRGIAPSRVLENRRKVGFNAPIYSFLNTADPEVRSYLLDEGPIFDHVKKGEIEKLIGLEFLPNSESKFLFSFLCCKMFLEGVAV
jgi:asparagine synthase (glutamine-hydrolysing)